MRNIYLASVNPMHYSHLHTYKKACEIHGIVFLCIVQNELKSQGLFSVEERSQIASEYYGIPSSRIKILHNRNEVITAIRKSEKIIRGIRGEKDILEIQKLVGHYGVEEDFNKLSQILVPDELKEISSSKLIERIKNNTYVVSDNWIPESLYYVMRNRLSNT
jgi:phosphopantetheine adenylyltransferase